MIDSMHLWGLMRVMWEYQEVKKERNGYPGCVFFYAYQEIEYINGTIAAANAARVIRKAELDGTMTLLKGIPEQYACTHALVPKYLK